MRRERCSHPYFWRTSIRIVLVANGCAPDRSCAAVIFYVLRMGCQWQAVDQTELCGHATAHDRLQPSVAAGVLLQL
jgi:transposase